MEPFRIYKELEITYREFSNALLRLGYKEVHKADQLFFVNKKRRSEILLPLPQKSMDEYVLKAYTAGYSYAMVQQGVIEDIHDFAKLVEQMRLEPLSVAA